MDEDLHRFGEKVDVGDAAEQALQELEQGAQPPADKMAALLFALVTRKDPETVKRLAATRQKRSDP